MQLHGRKSKMLLWSVVLSMLNQGWASHLSPCPSNCTCDTTIIDCSNKQLISVPPFHLQSPALVVNFSSNSITSLENLPDFSAAQTSLDLSFNRISSVPVHAFSGEPFLDLHTLNLSNNLISEIHFAFPSSLRVLHLGKNQLRDFCVERLGSLQELRTLYLEMNALRRLQCQPPEKSDGRTSVQGSCPFQPFQRIREVLLRGNKLKAIDDVFHCFHRTHSLSLAENAITSLPAMLFLSFQQLRYLDLSGNLLTSIAAGVFEQLPRLKYLSLARNRLAHMPASLPMLEWLDLSHNAIASISESQRGDLYPQEVFLIGGNPFHCKCNLLWLKELFDTREYLLKYLQVDRTKFVPVCASPEHLRGDAWDVLGDQAFGCEDSNGRSSKERSLEERDTVADGAEFRDLTVRARDVGISHIRLDWECPNLARERWGGRREPRRVVISCHPFGKKQEKTSAVAQLSLGTHRMRGLKPSTAYIVCIALADMSSGEPRPLPGGDCIEVVTKGDEQSDMSDIYMRVGVVVLVCLVLSIKCCYTNSVRTDIATRRKVQ